MSKPYVHGYNPRENLRLRDQANTLVTITASSHLDPSCTWTRGVEIVASDVVLDCQGAHIVTADRRFGIHVVTPADVDMSNVTIRNCRVEGFLNDVRVERDGARDLAAGVEYDHHLSDVTIEDSTFVSSRGVGVYVDAYVTGVTLRNLHVESAGSTGIYLEHGSRDNVVDGNEIVNNGFKENSPSGQFFTLGSATFWFWGTGREGLAVDGSRDNTITNNHFSGNSAGGIFLYKNCGEFVHSKPGSWFERRYGANGNLIEGNTFTGGDNGVWVAARQSENTFPMDCSDPQYLPGFSLDHASDNQVRGNVFQDVTWGVRVEDDRTVVADNQFLGSDAGHQAILVGTHQRTTALGQPVDGTVITGNQTAITGNDDPYRWIYGQTGTTFAGNQSHGRPVGFCEGVEPHRNPFVFVVAVVPATPPDPPDVDPPVIAPPAPLPPCPLACGSGGAVVQPRIALRRLGAPAGDELLDFRGRVGVPSPFSPPLDPVATGVGVLVRDAAGAAVVDVMVPGGPFDPATRNGWTATRSGTAWRYLHRGPNPPGGITAVDVSDLSKKTPGLVKFRVKGTGLAAAPSELPLSALLVLDPPTAETGQCGAATFTDARHACTARGDAVQCR